jgi:hypothetical protein
MLILMDDGTTHAPTKKNIEDAFTRITQYSKAGDVVFIHYSGHGGRVEDLDGDEDDGWDETLIPVDYRNAGQIVDDDIYKMCVMAMPADVNVTVLVSDYCCLLLFLLGTFTMTNSLTVYCLRSCQLTTRTLLTTRWIVVTVVPPWTCRSSCRKRIRQCTPITSSI